MAFPIIILLFSLAEHILAYSAEGAFEIVGKILELGAGSDAVVGIAKSLIIFPSASVTYVFFHFVFLLLF